MNYHSDEWIKQRVQEHYKEALTIFPQDKILGIFLQGSQNYGLDYSGSDVDTKCIVLPTLEDVCLNRKAVSYTHVRVNNEHIDFKDLRVIAGDFKKQNINFLEILFTPYCLINKDYASLFEAMYDWCEDITRYDNYRFVKSVAGMSMEKHKALELGRPSQHDEIARYGWSCYTDDTKFLTKSGWKTYYEIDNNEEIATMNQKTKELEFQHFYQRFCNYYNDKIYNVETNNSFFSITPNHNIYTSPIQNINKNGHTYIEELADWRLQPIEDVLNGYNSNNKACKHRHLSLIQNNNVDLIEYDGIKITDDLLKIIGAFVSEGTVIFRNSKNNRSVKAIHIYQADINAKHNRSFINIMDSIKDIKVSRYQYKKKNHIHDYIIWAITDKSLREALFKWCNHGSKNKKLTDFIFNLSKRQAGILLDALCYGDGTDQQSRRVYYTISKKLAEDVQILSIMAGYYAVIMGGEYGYFNVTNKGTHHMFQVAIKKEKYEPNWCYFKVGENVTVQNYSGNVVCFSVPNSILITQRNGKIAIQGNCKQLHHIIRLHNFLKRWVDEDFFVECLIDLDSDYLVKIKQHGHEMLTLEEARDMAKKFDTETNAIKEKYIATHEHEIDENAGQVIDDVVVSIIRECLKKEIG